MARQILLTTTGTQNPVVIADFGNRSFAHPTVDFDLLSEFTRGEIGASVDLQAAITAGYVTLQDELGNSITDIDALLPSVHADLHKDGGTDEVDVEDLPTAAVEGDVIIAQAGGSLLPGIVKTPYAQKVVVAKSGGDFTSVKDAITSIIDASAVKPYIVQVYPGVYTEDPFTMKAYVSLIAVGSPYSTILETTDSNSHFIETVANVMLGNLAISGPTGVGYACIHHNVSSAIPTSCTDIQIRKGYYGILCDPTAQGILICSGVSLNFMGTPVQEMFRAVNHGKLILNRCNVGGAPGAVAIGYRASGPDAGITAQTSSFACAGGIGFSLGDGAKCRAYGCFLSKGHTAFHIDSSGSGTELEITGVIISDDFTLDILVESATALVLFNGRANKTKFSTVPGAEIAAVFVVNGTPEEAGLVIIGEAWLGTFDESVPLRAYSLAAYMSGYVSGGICTINTGSIGSGLDVDVALGEGFINTGTGVSRVQWSADTVTLDANAVSYIYVDVDGNVLEATSEPSELTNIVLAVGVADATDVVMLVTENIDISHQAVAIHEWIHDSIGNLVISGLQTTINAPLGLDVDSGGFYHGTAPRSAGAGVGVTWTYWYRDGGPEGWASVLSQTAVDEDYYDGGGGSIGGGLVVIPAGEWKKDCIYVSVDPSDVTQYHVVYGQETFASQVDAQNGPLPTPPDFLKTWALRSAGIIIQQGSGAITETTDERPFIGQQSSGTTGVTVHGDLSGLASDDHSQYLPTSGARNMGGALDMGGNQITNVGNVNGVDVSAHETRHRPGGIDGLPTAVPSDVGSANAEGSSSSLARADHVHDHGAQSVGTMHAAATTVVNGFMSGADKTKLDNAVSLSDTAPVDVTKAAAAAGVAADGSRQDHKHDVSTTAPGATGVATASAEGLATTLARSDHAHQSNTAPADVTKGAAVIGTSGEPARADHKHDITTAAPAGTAVQIGNAAAEGAATTVALSDHKHAVAAGTPVSVGTANAAGAAATFPRSDHVHSGLTRGAADFSTFSGKTAPVGADRLLIEDSADSNNKKNLLVSNVLKAYSGIPIQGKAAAIAVDTTTASIGWTDLLSVSIVTGANNLELMFTVGVSTGDKAGDAYFRFTVDAVAKHGVGLGGVVDMNSAALSWRGAVTATAHTVKVQWRSPGGDTIRIRPVTAPDTEHAQLLVREVT